jgi:hypothetical protein
MKIDLHLHSSHSKRSSQWVLQKIGCPESFSPAEAANMNWCGKRAWTG